MTTCIHLVVISGPLAFALPLAHTEGPIVRGSPASQFVLSDSVSPGSDLWTRDTATTRALGPRAAWRGSVEDAIVLG